MRLVGSREVRACALVALFLLFVVTSETKAERLPIKAYTTADGLPYNTVKRIAKDSHGFLWFCTTHGLSRFDGSRFVNYGLEDGLSFISINDFIETRDGGRWVATNGGGVCRFNPYVGLPVPITDKAINLTKSRFTTFPVGDSPQTNRVNKLYEDKAGWLWAATDAGLFYLDRNDAEGMFRRAYLNIASRSDSSVQVWSLIEDRESILWIGTSHGLLERLPDGRMVHFPVHPSQGRDLVWALLLDREGKLWMGHETGLFVFAPPQLGSARRYTTADGLSNNDVRALYQTYDGRLWIGANEGNLTVFDGRSFRTYTSAQGLNDRFILTLVEDRGGNLWAGTNSGAMKFSQSGFTTYTKGDGLGHDTICSILETPEGEFYAISGERRINRLDGTRFVSVRPNMPAHISDSSWRVHQSILRDHLGEWWIATSQGLCRFPKVNSIEQLATAHPKALYTAQHGLASNDLGRLFEDSRGDIWIGAAITSQDALTRWERATEKFYRYSDADGLPTSNAVSAFCEDASGNVWIGFREGGLARFREGRFSMFGTSDGLPLSGTIISLHSDQAGRLWVATQLGGLSRIENPMADRLQIVTYTVADGLESDYLSYITEDNHGRFFIGTTRGVDRFDPATGHIRHYTPADGLAANGLLTAFRDRQGTLWFGTIRGLSKLIAQPDLAQLPPLVLISGLRAGGTAYRISDLGESSITGLELGINHNQIEIDFFGFSFGSDESLRYQYRLEGSGEDWKPASETRSVNYASLSPGTYSFIVRAISADGAMSLSPANVDFKILPPIWRRWWFLLLAAILIAAMVFAIERYRAARMRAIKESEDRFRTLAETASDAIITINEQSIIIYANPAAETVFGYSISEMIGQDLTMLMPEYLRHLHRAGLNSYLRTGRKHLSWEAIELPGLHKSGREIPLEISFGEFTKNDGHFFTGVARDITERKRAEEALIKSREERITELEHVRRRIATDLHDDIGSSLSQIFLLSEVARQKISRNDGTALESLSMIANASHELVGSMSDIVWAINPQKDHLSDLVLRMRRFASEVFEAANIELHFRAPGIENDLRLESSVRREVFLIFKESVNNMARHSGCREAGIEFTLTDDSLALRMTDDGRGFEPANDSDGHGLVSMRERARVIGGAFDIVSSPGRGTIVTLTVPLDKTASNFHAMPT